MTRPGDLRRRIHATWRRRHLSPRTEKAYFGWIKRFILFHGNKHPGDLGSAGVSAFLEHLATAHRVAASTQNQAMNAFVFLYREVLERDLEEGFTFTRARRSRRLPVVLSRREITRVLSHMDGIPAIIARLLYGSGLRISEAVTLRVKDVDFELGVLHIHQGKGARDRKAVLPERLRHALRRQMERSRARHQRDLADGF